MTRNRKLGRLLQRKYLQEHPECEWSGRTPAQVHEIFYGSRKFYDEDNFITLHQEFHDLAHAGVITKEMLCKVKGISYHTLRQKAEGRG